MRAQLIRIDYESGELKWDQAVGRDSFENEVSPGGVSAVLLPVPVHDVWHGDAVSTRNRAVAQDLLFMV